MEQGNNVSELIRERFVKVNREYAQVSGGKVYAEPSKIRIEKELLSGVGTYEFDIKKTDIRNMREVSIDRNDVFIPNFLGVFLTLEDNSKPACGVLSSFPLYNDGVNPSPYVAGFQNHDVEAIYNGKFNWVIDNGVLFSSYPMEHFRVVPQTQGDFALDSNDQAVNLQTLPEWNILKSCELLYPRITIAGTRDHKIRVNFDGAGLTFPVTAGYTPKLTLYMDGFLIKGGCEYFNGANPNASAVGQW
ncbi:MAG: hypothetical protein J6S67_26115 [Methanobrevibacter sp.]|nr:hypothetical protein [Methanobrevibacter sp.]